MRRKDVKKMDSLLQLFVKSNKLEKGLAEYRLMKAWKELLPGIISKRTKDLRIHNRTLIVSLESSVIANELMMMKESLIPRLNEEAGMEVIDDIVFR